MIVVTEHQDTPSSIISSPDWKYGSEVLVERYIPGLELNCGVMGDTALAVIEIMRQGQGFYDHEVSMRSGFNISLLARTSERAYRRIQELPVKTHKAIGRRGLSWGDFQWDDEGKGEVVWLEVNTQPGMTETRLCRRWQSLRVWGGSVDEVDGWGC